MSTCGRAVVAVHSVHDAETSPRHDEAPVPGGDEGLGRVVPQRQRIDITSPRIIAPKPMAKLYAPRDAMKGMSLPAT